MIDIKNVSKSFNKKTVISNMSIELPDTGVVCLFGKTGSGKTTLLNILCGILTPDNGEVIGLENKRISYVFQDDRLLSWLNVEQNLSISNNLGDTALNDLLEYFEMSAYRNLLVSKLSRRNEEKGGLNKGYTL